MKSQPTMENTDTETDSIIRRINQIISPIYLVGGSVRDILLSKTPHDYDFTTPLLPDEIETAVKRTGRRAHTVGKRFGTIGFKLDGMMIEVTTFRLETYSPGSRKPMVEFVDDITHDLSRRDFTINAMAMREDGHIVDPFGGRSDLEHRIIRTVNKPFDRYNEDPLRMLRAARLIAQLGFAAEEQTERQAAKKAHNILEVSKERWGQEMDKLLLADQPELGLGFLARTGLINFMIPELAIQVGYNQDSPYHQLELWDHTIKTVSLTPPDPTLRWAALLHDVGKPYVRTKNSRGYSNYVYHDIVGSELAEKIGLYLKWPKARVEAVSQLVRHHLEASSPLQGADAAATRA